MLSSNTSTSTDAGQQCSLVTFPKNRRIELLDFQNEGQWRGPFWFMQAADTQLGMIDSYLHKNKENPSWQAEIELCQRLVSIANGIRPRPRFLAVCGDLVDATPRTLKDYQIKDFKKVFSLLDPEIKLICVCGNHDVTDHPTVEDIQDYRRQFGDDYFSFWIGGSKFLVLNSQYYLDDSRVKQFSSEQGQWLEEQLNPNAKQPWKHLIGFQHVPPFINRPDEAIITVPGSETLPFNFPNLQQRSKFLRRLKQAGMSHLFCGHYHRNGGGVDERLEVVVTTAVGCQLGSDDHGFRAVVVTPARVRHQFYTLKAPPTSIDLS